MQVPLRFNYLFALEPIYLNIKGIDLLLIIIIERLEYTLPLFLDKAGETQVNNISIVIRRDSG